MKKRLINKQWAIVAMAILLTALGSGKASAVPTASGTTITNKATVDYEVSGAAQTQKDSGDYTFKVDTKVDVTVTAPGTAVTLTPGAVTAVTFKVSNTGNKQQGFKLYYGDYNDVADNLDSDAAYSAYSEGTGNDTYEPGAGNDTNTEIYHLDANTETYVHVLVTTPASATNDQKLNVYLKVQTYEPDAGATLTTVTAENENDADDKDIVQVVFGDVAGLGTDVAEDGYHSAYKQCVVAAASISITKSSIVLSDPFTDTGNFKRIPQAVVEYKIIVTNADGTNVATADNVEITDNISAQVGTTYDLVAYDGTNYLSLRMSECDNNNEFILTNVDSDSSERCGADGYYNSTDKKLVVRKMTLIKNSQAVIRFKVRIK